MRGYGWVLFFACSLMLLPATSVQGTTVNLSDMHVSIDVPVGWTWQRNYTIVGVTYDLWMEGPVSGGYIPVGSLLIGPWLGVITDGTLYAEMAHAIDALETVYGSSNVQIISAPLNTTINGEKASDATISVTSSGVTIKERLVIVVSDALMQEYGLALAVVDDQWPIYSATFSAIVNSLTIAEPDRTPVAAFTVSSASGLVIDVNASGSYDPDGTVVSYVWDWGDETVDSPSALPTANHTYAASGNYTIQLTVTDDSGNTGTALQDLTVVKEEGAGGLSMPVMIGMALSAVMVIIAAILYAARKKKLTAQDLSQSVQISHRVAQPPAPSYGMQMFCPYCGNRRIPEAAFCPSCGQRLA